MHTYVNTGELEHACMHVCMYAWPISPDRAHITTPIHITHYKQ